MTETNYYILLELDPSVTDVETIEIAIKKKQEEWSIERNHPTKGMKALNSLSKLYVVRHAY